MEEFKMVDESSVSTIDTLKQAVAKEKKEREDIFMQELKTIQEKYRCHIHIVEVRNLTTKENEVHFIAVADD